MDHSRSRSRLILYLDTKLTAGQLVSLALVALNGQWFYAEMVDLPPDTQEELLQQHKLRRVAGTSFAKPESLAPIVQHWLAAQAKLMGCDAAKLRLVIRTSDKAAGSVLRPTLQVGADLCCADIAFEQRHAGQAALADYFAHCGGLERVCGHSLIDAMGLAICDTRRQEAIELFDIFPFGLLMGAKNATSYRAWLGRHEAKREVDAKAKLPRSRGAALGPLQPI